jgi:hypothetical protein
LVSWLLDYYVLEINSFCFDSEVPKVFEEESGDNIDEKLKSRADARKTEKEHVLSEKVNYSHVRLFV